MKLYFRKKSMRSIRWFTNGCIGSIAAIQTHFSPMAALGWKADTRLGQMSALADTGRSGSLKSPNLSVCYRPIADVQLTGDASISTYVRTFRPMRLLNSIKNLLQLVPNPLRRKVYRVKTLGGTDWLVLARKKQPGWEKTDISPKEYQEQVAALEEMIAIIESGDTDDRRFMALQEKAAGIQIYPRSDNNRR